MQSILLALQETLSIFSCCSVPRRLTCGDCVHLLLCHLGFSWLRPLGSKGWRWKAGESEVGIPTPWCGIGCVPLRKVTAPVGWPLLRLLPGSDHHNPRCLFRARGGQGALRVGTPGCPTTPMVSLVNTPLFNSPQLPCWTEPCHSCQDSGWTHLLMSSYG